MKDKNSEVFIELKNVSFSYLKKRKIFDNISLSINKGEIIGIIGSSGEGKSTLIKLLNGSLVNEYSKNIEGSINILGKDIKNFKKINRYVGTVYQNPDDQIIFTNVVDELVFGMENYNYSKADMENKYKNILKQFNISYLEERNPNNLSGGEKQLIVLGAILCLDVKILLLDEAFASVDHSREQKILEIIKQLKEEGRTIIMVEHDKSHLNIADKIYNLKEGKLIEINKKIIS